MLQLVSCTLHFYDAHFSKNISVHAFRLMGTGIDLWVSWFYPRDTLYQDYSVNVFLERHSGKFKRLGELVPQLVNPYPPNVKNMVSS
jgi:hypothetical protein